MINQTTKTKEIPVQSYTTTTEKFTEYTCSDGKVFTSENDKYKGHKTGLELAEEHELYLNKIDVAKKELKFHSIANDKDLNYDYEHEFCFYFHKDLSEETIKMLYDLVFDLKETGYDWDVHLSDLTEGWYLVKQNIEMEENYNSCHDYYYNRGDVYFGLLSEYTKLLKEKYDKYSTLEEKL